MLSLCRPAIGYALCEQKEAVRGATYDLLDDRGADAFGALPADAYASLSQSDRQRIQQRVLA